MPHIKPRTATVPIYQGDDMEHLGDLRRQVMLAERALELERERDESRMSQPVRIGDDDSSGVPAAQLALDDAQAAYDAGVDEVEPRALMVGLQAIGRRRYRELLLANAPREVDDPDGGKKPHPDDRAGFNADTFPMALLTFRDGDTSTIVAPEFKSSAEVQAFVDDELAEGDYERLWYTAYELNVAVGADPSQSRYSVGRRGTETNSTSPDRLG